MAKQTTNIGARVGLLGELARNGRLAWQLLKDPGVPLAYKLIIPGIAGLYLLSPVDLLPDFVPFLGQLDDLAIIVLAVKLFIELAPKDILNQHRYGQERVVDAEYRVID
ncbi:MAG: hypothetical protein BWY52_02676 [Chloroflexi bacterium ADurb.Bin325]|nr:MAG: hypothetical protein BWY52_02676 [Chloroflexi bacterium ADurb.Bin325]